TNIVETVVNALQAGVEKYNAWLQNDTDAAHYSKRERSQKRRADLCAKLRQFLSAVDNISVHEKRGTLLIAVGSDHLLHVKNINRYSLLASIPKMLQEPKDPIYQLTLPGFEDDTEFVPLHEMGQAII